MSSVDGKWIVRERRTVYDNEWATVSVADVELPDKQRIEHHIVSRSVDRSGASVLAQNSDKEILLIWRHRFITDNWGWELPGGGVDPSESPVSAAEREMLEETGWRPSKLRLLTSFEPMNGLVDYKNDIFYTNSVAWEGPGRDINEASDIAWLPLGEVRSLIKKGDVPSGHTLVALLWAMQFGTLSSTE